MKKIFSVFLVLALIISTIGIGFNFTALAETVTPFTEGIVEFDSASDMSTQSPYVTVANDGDKGVLSIAGGGGTWKYITLPFEPELGVQYSYTVKYRVAQVNVNTDNNCLQLVAANAYDGYNLTGLDLIPAWSDINTVDTEYKTLNGTFDSNTVGFSGDYPHLALYVYNGDTFYIDSIEIRAIVPFKEGIVEFDSASDMSTQSPYVTLANDGDKGVLSIAGGGGWKFITLPFEPELGVQYSYTVKYRVAQVDITTDNNCFQLYSTSVTDANYNLQGIPLIGQWSNITTVDTEYKMVTGTFDSNTVGLSSDHTHLALFLYNGDTFYIDSIEILAMDTNYAGSGTAADPYRITNVSELYGFASVYATGNSIASDDLYFELTNDIYINDTTNPEWVINSPRSWVYVSSPAFNNLAQGFRGHFDGKGHTVYGLYYPYADDAFCIAGLIPLTSGNAVISNVNVRYAYAENPNAYGGLMLGGIVGAVNKNSDETPSNVTVEKCVVDNTVDFSSVSTGRTGGIVGCVRESNIAVKYCGSAVNFDNGASPSGGMGGGIVGQSADWAVKGISIKNSYCLVAFTTSVGSVSKASISDGTFYSAHDWWSTVGVNLIGVPEANMKGGSALIYMPNLGWDVWQANDGTFPTIQGSTAAVSGEPEDDPSDTFKIDPWDGTVAVHYAGGTGTVLDPYLISTPEQLRKLVTTNEDGKYYLLTNDIYLNDIDYYASWGTVEPEQNWWNWTLNNTASPTVYVDGNGYTVYGLYSVTDSFSGGNQYAGLFANIGSNSRISNLHIRKSYVAGLWTGTFVGSVCGAAGTSDSFTLSGCSVDDTVTVGGTYGGSLIGVANANITVENCYSAATLSATSLIGGIYGDVWSAPNHTFINCYSDGWFPLPRTRESAVAKVAGSRTYTNVYYLLSGETTTWEGLIPVTSMAEVVMPDTHWYGTAVKYLKNRGARNFDLNEDDSDAPNAEDLVVLRQALLFGTTPTFGDCNADKTFDIRDLICLKKKISFFS